VPEIGELPAWTIDDAFGYITPDRTIEKKGKANPKRALQKKQGNGEKRKA